MSDAVAKPTPKKPAKKKPAKKKPAKPPRQAAVDDVFRTQPTGLESLHAACDTIRQFIQTLAGWDLEADSLEAMAAVGLLQRTVFYLEGEWRQPLTTDDGDQLDAALRKLIRPRR